MELVYIDGDFVDADKAGVSTDDLWSLNAGCGLFETMQGYNGRVFLFDEHLKRLAYGAEALSINSPHLKKFIIEKRSGKVADLLKRNSLTECNAYIKIVVTKERETNDPSIIIFAKAIEAEKNAELRENGVEAMLIDEPKRFMPNIKNLNYMANILARKEAKEQNAYDALFRSSEDLILEGSATNIFIVRDDYVITPPLSGRILPGITRQMVIDLVRADGITVNEADVKSDELINADEAFLTNSIIEVVPLIKVNSSMIRGGKPGEITKRIGRLYHEATDVK